MAQPGTIKAAQGQRTGPAWRRRAVLIATLITSGAMVNLLISWGCTLLSVRSAWTASDVGDWPFPPPAGSDIKPLVCQRMSFGVQETEARGALFRQPGAGLRSSETLKQYQLRAGWPFASCERRLTWEEADSPKQLAAWEQPPASLSEGWDIGWLAGALGAPRDRHLPIVPVWTAFTLGTLVWTAFCAAARPLCSYIWIRFRPYWRIAWRGDDRAELRQAWNERLDRAQPLRAGEALAITWLQSALSGKKRTRMRTMLGLLAIGFSAAWGVAWICAALSPFKPFIEGDAWAWGNERAMKRSRDPDWRIVSIGLGIDILERRTAAAPASKVESGWPMRMLGWEADPGLAIPLPKFSTPSGTRRRMSFLSCREGISLELVIKPVLGSLQRRLPLAPIPVGMAVDVVVFAAGLGAIGLPILVYRSCRRASRAECPACGFPVGTSVVCTECGRPVRFGQEEGEPPNQPAQTNSRS